MVGEKTRHNDFLTSTRIWDERDDIDWLKERDLVSSNSHYGRMIKGTRISKDQDGGQWLKG